MAVRLRAKSVVTSRSMAGVSRRAAGMVVGLRGPEVGDCASGYDVESAIGQVSEDQPLAASGIWRVILVGELFGRLVSWGNQGVWRLLQLNDLTRRQIDTLSGTSRGLGKNVLLPSG